ncbi:hypothetical protein [Pontibacter rugosus]|uniref:Uncharacterized protein n=1 Tax=Pontibacter rugosus TaxID=1745966 RepID=A0ABW3SQU2_9BACT
MWRRKAFNWLRDQRKKAAGWANQRPRFMIAAMFAVMGMGLVWLLFIREERQASSLDGIFLKLHQAQPATPAPTADMLELLRLYSAVQAINPDSLTARDSAFLKDIDQQLNSIIHEKD